MNFLHERDFGDIVLSLAVVKAASDNSNYYIQNNPNAVKLLTPLIEFQSYIIICDSFKSQDIDKSFVDFRKQGLPWGVELGLHHATWVKQKTDFYKQWLSAPQESK
jgi:hypothetical protein